MSAVVNCDDRKKYMLFRLYLERFRGLQRSLNIEFYRDYVFRNQYEELQYIQEELEKIKNSGDLMAIRRLQKQLKYLQCFYDKVNNNFEFIKELGVCKEYPFCEISEEHKKK